MVRSKAYCPKRGDVVYLDFDPQAGHETGKRRPALVLSPKSYNGKAKLVVCCPITHQVKGYPFEVPLPESAKVTGVILADQVKCLDWEERNAEFYCALSPIVLKEVLNRLLPVLGV